MIGRIRGELIEAIGQLVVVDCAGVGYEVTVTEDHALQLPEEGGRLDLLIRQITREDGSTLYGFSSPAARRVFDLLLRVNGCGPRVALAILGQVGVEETVRAILNEDVKRLMIASGVGKRLGERILLELKPTIEEEAIALKISAAPAPTVDGPADRDLVDALIALGYKAVEAERAAAGIPAGGDMDRRIVAALQLLKR